MDLNGKIIVIEGTDGSGKQTQTKILKDRLEENGYEVYTTSFPNYESESSAAVKLYLNGEIKKSPNDVSAKAASIFYAVDRYITYKREIESIYNEAKKVIVFDRWVSSNIVHQGQKLLFELSKKDIKPENYDKFLEFIKWLDKLEHEDFEVPRADITIYLNVPLEYTKKLRENRLNKIDGKEKQDIHESDNNHLINSNNAGLTAAKLLKWDVIDCVKDDKMRSIEDIGEEIWQTILKK